MRKTLVAIIVAALVTVMVGPVAAQQEPGLEYGPWDCEQCPFPTIYQLSRDGDKLVMTTMRCDGSSGEHEQKATETREGLRLDKVPPPSTSDYLVINENGELELRDEEGIFVTARRVPAGRQRSSGC